jgi:hypothetical protein
VTWNDILQQVRSKIEELDASGCPDPYFRGHSCSSWKLLPSLSRAQLLKGYHNNKELRLFLNFKSMGAKLIPRGLSSWEILFLMQHHGLPTRLLDWTTNFSMALFFAARHHKPKQEVCVWILNPYTLNEAIGQGSIIKHIEDATGSDYISFANTRKTSPLIGAMAISPGLDAERIISQRGNFTLHGNLNQPLEDFCPHALTKISIPENLLEDAKGYLRLSGINEFSAFPDLDGLARYLMQHEKLI